ncbi:MAG: hypothetical protein Q7S05_01245 [bacterium]|nr:hypothetical protein [bacterium]
MSIREGTVLLVEKHREGVVLVLAKNGTGAVRPPAPAHMRFDIPVRYQTEGGTYQLHIREAVYNSDGILEFRAENGQSKKLRISQLVPGQRAIVVSIPA